MKLVVNGEEMNFPETLSIKELLKKRDIKSPQMVSVELNDEIISRNDFDTTRLKDNDKVDFLFFMGGGSD